MVELAVTVHYGFMIVNSLDIPVGKRSRLMRISSPLIFQCHSAALSHGSLTVGTVKSTPVEIRTVFLDIGPDIGPCLHLCQILSLNKQCSADCAIPPSQLEHSFQPSSSHFCTSNTVGALCQVRYLNSPSRASWECCSLSAQRVFDTHLGRDDRDDAPNAIPAVSRACIYDQLAM